ncbi:hypothetical protein ACPA9J_03530 [Pseudomonas aeruginosa]
MGATAKVRSAQAAAALGRRLQEVGSRHRPARGPRVTDGERPVGRGSARHWRPATCWAVLQGTPRRPRPTCGSERCGWRRTSSKWAVQRPPAAA